MIFGNGEFYSETDSHMHSFQIDEVIPQLLKCMLWRLDEKNNTTHPYVGVGLSKDMGPISSQCIVMYLLHINQ